jgi:hypothetical protein
MHYGQHSTGQQDDLECCRDTQWKCHELLECPGLGCTYSTLNRTESHVLAQHCHCTWDAWPHGGWIKAAISAAR